MHFIQIQYFSLLIFVYHTIYLKFQNFTSNNELKRDDFFYFIASILSSPSEYIYKKGKINY